MGWAADDEKQLPLLRAKVSRARESFYSLKSHIREIRHDEKREAMLAPLNEAEELIEQAFQKLYDVDTHLTR